MEHEYVDPNEDAAQTHQVGVNKTPSDFTEDEWAALTPAQREALERADRGELPVDARSPLYNEPASENFVHSLDPRVAAGEVEATDTVPDALLTSQTGDHGLVTSASGDIVVDERSQGAATEPDGPHAVPSGEFPPVEGAQSDGSPTTGGEPPADFDGGNGPADHLVLDGEDADPDDDAESV